MRYFPDDERFVYSGRIDWTQTQKPVFVFPCTSVSFRFTGKSLKIFVSNRNCYWDNYLGYILDGKQSALLLPKEGEAELLIQAEEKTEVHECLLFKRQDACHEVTFLGIETEEGAMLLEGAKKPERRIEVYGDSVSAGEVSEAVDYTAKEDPVHNGEYSNSWYSYAWMTARKLGAQIHDIAQGGIALLDGTGWFHQPDTLGMENAWDKIHYNPQFGESTDWDFSLYTPQVVIVAIGQNDNHPDDYMKEDYHGERAERWRWHYKAFLLRLRNQYPQAEIVCCTTLLNHHKSWDDSIGSVVESLNDPHITQYIFGRNGRGTPGHLRISEAQEMADELAEYIADRKPEGWV